MSWHPDATDIQALIDGELDAHARRGVEAHLQGCVTCAAIAARLRGVSQVLCAVPRAAAPPDLHERILSAVGRAPRVVEPACAECAEMASAYVDGELSGTDRDAFEAHVFTCPTCYAALTHTEGPAQVLRATPRHAPPDDLFERITAAVAAEQDSAVRFTWRRALAVGAGLAAAAAIMAALLLPGARVPDQMVTPPGTFAEQPAEVHATEPTVAAAPADSAPETVATPAVQPSAMAGAPGTASRGMRADDDSRPARTSSDAARPAPTPSSDETRIATAPLLPRDTVGGGAVTPVLPPATTPRPVFRPRPSPTPVAPAPSPAPTVATATPEPAAPRPEPAPIAPAETAVALAPRTTGPEARVAGPVSVPVPPVPAAAGATGSHTDEPVRLAVVPRQQGARTLYRASSGPAEDKIERARVAMARGQSLGFDDPRTGIALR